MAKRNGRSKDPGMSSSGTPKVPRSGTPKVPRSGTPKVSIIVPSWTGEVSRLEESIRQQTFRDYELEIVTGVSPAGRARNIGARRSHGDILLFIDDDAYFGNPHVLERLVRLIESDPRM